jgi:hypothetical protein
MIIGVFEVVNALVCEDVRREVNGKEILIGVYGNSILVPSFPIDLNLMFWFQTKAPEGDHELKLRISNASDAVFLEASVNAHVSAANELASLAVGTMIQAQNETTLKFQGRNADSDWSTIVEIPIRRGPVQPTRKQ